MQLELGIPETHKYRKRNDEARTEPTERTEHRSVWDSSQQLIVKDQNCRKKA